METELIIGYYGKNAFTGNNDTLKELNVSNFNRVVAETEVCPYTPEDSKYKQWKETNNHLLFFTTRSLKPQAHGVNYRPSGFASIDIDHRADTDFTSTHPSVWGINKTPNGTHIIVYGVFGRTPYDWQHSYLCIAYEVLDELKAKYGSDIRMDGKCAKCTQGCFLWNSKWDFSNTNFDLSYRAANRGFDNEDIDEMFEKRLDDGKWKQSFSWEQTDTAYNAGAKKASNKTVRSESRNDTETLNLASEIGIDKTMRSDLYALDRVEWLRKYEGKFRFIYESPTKYEKLPNYKGDWVEMAFLDGQHARLWLPRPVWSKDGKVVGCKRPRGTRIKSTHYHLKCLARLMDETMDGAEPNQMLYNAVYYVANQCEGGIAKSEKCNGYDVSNSEILACVVSAYNTYKDDEDDILYRNKQLYKCGNNYIDGETGEEVHLNAGDPSRKSKKIALNAYQRKTLRIRTAVEMFDPSKSIEDNCERLRDYSRLEGITVKTLKEYVRLAKGLDWLVVQFPWLADYELTDSRKSSLAIEDRRNGKVMKFETVKECLKRLKWSKPTYYKFLKGESRYNKIYALKTDKQ